MNKNTNKLKQFCSGYLFEQDIIAYVSSIPGISVHTNLRVYSHKLGKDTEIDIVLYLDGKCYLLEVKKYQSYIRGSMEDRMWAYGSRGYQNKTMNPFNQNFIHKRALQFYLCEKLRKFIQCELYVVVPDSCTISTDCDNVVGITTFIHKLRLELGNKKELHKDLKVIEALKEASGC